MNSFKQLGLAAARGLAGSAQAIGNFFGYTGYAGANTVLYESALPSRSRQNITSTPQDSRRDLNRMSRTVLLGKARFLFANNGLTRGAIRDKARYAVGHGLRPHAQTANKAWNKAAQEYWENWCKVADVRGKYNFNAMQRLMSIAIDRDGDLGLVMVKSPNGFPQVQLVESHRIGDPGLDGPLATGDGTSWFDGLLLDKNNQVLAYSVVTQDALGVKTKEDVPASNFIHIFDGERADQFRGITALYHAINTIQDVKEIVDFEKKGVKLHSAIGAVLKTKSNSLEKDWKDGEGDSENGTQANGEKVKLDLMQILDGGEIPIIGERDTLDLTKSDRPSPAFKGFLDWLARDVCCGLGVPVEFVWDASKLQGTAQRFILEKAQRAFDERQDLLIHAALNRLWFWVISCGIKRGDLEFQEGAWQAKWQRPSKITVDAGNDAAAALADVEAGLQTAKEHYGRRGLDWEKERDQKENEVDDLLTRAMRQSKKHGTDLEYTVQLLQQTTPNMPAQAPQPPPQESDPEDKQDDDSAAAKKKKKAA
jgi:capsid protein